MRDSYIRFFSEGCISKEQFFDLGLKETIYAPYDKVEIEWSNLKQRIINNEEVFIRGFGRDASGTHLFQELYARLVGKGLLGHELFAIDGCKMPSNAAKEGSGTFKELEQKRAKIKRQIRHHINEHKQLDKNESSHEERGRRAEQAIDTLNKAHDTIDQFLKANSPRQVFAPAKPAFPTSL